MSTARRRFLSNTSLAVYATIVATAVLAGVDDVDPDWGAWQFLVTLIGTLVVLFFAEVYSDVLGDPSPETLRARLARAADHRWAVLEPAVPLGIPLLLGIAGVISVDAAIWATLGVAVAALAFWGSVTARQRGRSWAHVVGAGVVSALIGVVIIVLKAWH